MKTTITAGKTKVIFDLEQDQANALIQMAFRYSMGDAEGIEDAKEASAASGRISASGQQQEQEPVATPCITKRSRVASLFPDFKPAEDKPQVEQVEQDEQPAAERESDTDSPKAENEEGYKCFLLIRCGTCGRTRAFKPNKPITSYLCMCGGTTQLHDLKAAYMYCKCGANFKYRTNLTDDKISHECLKCGTQVEMAINYRGTAYITV